MDLQAAVYVALVLGVINPCTYVFKILKRGAKPHPYTFGVFAIIVAVGFAAQIADGAGIAAAPLGVTLLGVTTIFGFSVTRGRGATPRRSDLVALSMAVIAIGLWGATDDPTWSVILISVVDGIAIIPTLRKSWAEPFEEPVLPWSIGTVQVLFLLAGLPRLTLVSALYPAAIAVYNATLIALILLRRRAVARPQPASA